jgi:sodium/bile acid cotransporter 7
MSIEERQKPPRGATGWFKKVLNLILAQYLVIGFATACVFGYFFPCKLWFSLAAKTSANTLFTAVAQHGGVIRSEYSILYGAVAFIFLVSGLQLSPGKLRENVTNWRLHILVHGISFAVIPAIVLGELCLCRKRL